MTPSELLDRLVAPPAATARRRARTLPGAPPVPTEPRVEPRPARDVALDLLRGLAMLVLVVNHLQPESFLEVGTRSLISAAEVLVLVSGVAVGMVFGRRWRVEGGRATALALVRRARTLYLASVVVVGGAALAVRAPGVDGEVLRFSPRAPERDLLPAEDPVSAVVGVLTLASGPWQYNILGFFIAALAVVAPATLWALHRGHWPLVVGVSWAAWLVGRETGLDLLPSQSERPFPLLVWQLLLVHGVVLGWHRRAVEAWCRRHARAATAALLAVAGVAAALQLGGGAVLAGDGAAWAAWEDEHYGKTTLDPLRAGSMAAFAAAAWLVLRHWQHRVVPVLGPVLLPLGRNSFYVFIVQVPLCLAVASLPGVSATSLGTGAAAVLQVACVGLLVLMVRRRFLFRWIPR